MNAREGGDSGRAEENEDVTRMGKSASPSPGKGDTDGLEDSLAVLVFSLEAKVG